MSVVARAATMVVAADDDPVELLELPELLPEPEVSDQARNGYEVPALIFQTVGKLKPT